jgi:hypothetical protein
MFLETVFAIGTLLSAYSTYEQYQSAAAAADFQSGIASQNAMLAKKQERELDRQSLATAKRLELETEQFMQEQLVAYSNSGVDSSSATVQEVIRSTARTGAADIVESMNNFAKEAWAKGFESRIERKRAGFERAKARSYRLIAPYAATADILTGAAGLYYQPRST